MMNKRMLDIIRSKYPDNRTFNRLLARSRVKRTMRTIIPLERTREAEVNGTEKELLVKESQRKWPAIAKKLDRQMNDILRRAPQYQGRDDLDQIRTDMMFCWFAYGFPPDEYLCYDLEGKSMEERTAFVSDLDRYCYVYRMNSLKGIQIFNNKGKTYTRFEKYYGREVLYLEREKDFDLFRQFLMRHPVFVRKAVYEGMGRSVALVDMTEGKVSDQDIFRDMIAQGPHVVEERIHQGEVLASLNESSVNTIRCITMKTRHGVEIPYCFMKVGRAGFFVDNGGAGGILVGIDKDTGRLNTNGVDELNIRYKAHPDSRVTFQGIQLPQWEEMLHICREMSESIDSVKYIGWDMTYTDDHKWIVVEGNGMSQLIGPQTIWKRGVKAEVEQYMNDM